MSKLSKLEMSVLQKVANSVTAISTSFDDNSDDVNDFIYAQFNFSTDEPETLKACIDHFKLTIDNLEVIKDGIDLLVDHFK